MSRLHWIAVPTNGRLAIMARPRADDWLAIEIDGWKSAGLDLVVSLLEPDEVSELGLQNEALLCHERGIAFLSFSIPDRGIPAIDATRHLAGLISREVLGGRSVAIHCRAGIGRSSVIAACAMICSGIEAAEALRLIEEARGIKVPDTEAQRDWVIAFGEALKGS